MPMITDQSAIAFSDPLPDAVDVVVIGAGFSGMYQLVNTAHASLRVATRNSFAAD